MRSASNCDDFAHLLQSPQDWLAAIRAEPLQKIAVGAITREENWPLVTHPSVHDSVDTGFRALGDLAFSQVVNE